jgi:LysM repeat protein/ABC-type branched-subunit amino acid transport system substrate-binding protein
MGINHFKMTDMLNRAIFFLVGILFSVSFLAQPGEVPVETKDGNKVHVHTVAKTQTAYGISRLYNISINELYESNPEAQQGLSIGQKLYFPIKREVLLQEAVSIDTLIDKNILMHTVDTGETLYSIARKYGVPAADVIAANSNGTLALGSIVIVPLKNVIKNDVILPIVKDPINPSANPGDSIILHRVKKDETMYSLSKQYNVSIEEITVANDGLLDGLNKGMKLRIPLKKKAINVLVDIALDTLSGNLFDSSNLHVSSEQEVYDIAVMIPFFFDENRVRMANCPPIGDCPIYLHTLNALDFHHGVMMAIDSLKNAGLNVNIHVYDTKHDTAVVRGLLSKAEFSEIDLIIGPFYANQIKLVREFAKTNSIQLICPIAVSNKALFNNPFVTKMTASTPTQIKFMAQEIARKYHDQNVIVVRNQKNDEDEYYYRTFKNAFAEEIQKYPNRYLDSAKETYINSTGSRLSTVESKMVLDKNNLIVVPSQSVGHVSDFFTKLSSTTNSNPYRNYSLQVFGLEDWSEFPTIDEKYKNKFKLSLVTSSYVEYEDPKVLEFISNYRAKYATDPSDFSFIGFDAAFINLKGILLYGTGFSSHYEHLTNTGFSTNSLFEKVDPQGGYENKNVFIIRYEDYSVIKE